jgi:hypothetical protein
MGYRRYEKLITILVPCRARHERTRNLLNSIERNTDDKERLRVITITDFDAVEDHNNISDLINSNAISYELFNITRTRDLSLNKNYYNLANLLGESWFSWILGNDIEIETQGWDSILYDNTANHLDSLQKDLKNYYIFIHDDTHSSNHGGGSSASHGSCFPIVSNNYSEKVRGPMPEHLRSWGGDVELYGSCIEDKDSWEFIDLQDKIKISHYCPHNGKVGADEVSDHVRKHHNG